MSRCIGYGTRFVVAHTDTISFVGGDAPKTPMSHTRTVRYDARECPVSFARCHFSPCWRVDALGSRQKATARLFQEMRRIRPEMLPCGVPMAAPGARSHPATG
jgi:hypothetical protein